MASTATQSVAKMDNLNSAATQTAPAESGEIDHPAAVISAIDERAKVHFIVTRGNCQMSYKTILTGLKPLD
jgi:hypothetical protein